MNMIAEAAVRHPRMNALMHNVSSCSKHKGSHSLILHQDTPNLKPVKSLLALLIAAPGKQLALPKALHLSISKLHLRSKGRNHRLVQARKGNLARKRPPAVSKGASRAIHRPAGQAIPEGQHLRHQVLLRRIIQLLQGAVILHLQGLRAQVIQRLHVPVEAARHQGDLLPDHQVRLLNLQEGAVDKLL
jgi:hypothetical protein